MKIRQRTLLQFDATVYDGDLNKLFTFLSSCVDFNQLRINQDGSITVVAAGERTITLVVNDWIRVKEDGKLDRIRASNFAESWEIVP